MTQRPFRVVFHGANASSFADGIEDLIVPEIEIARLPDVLDVAGDERTYAAADIIVSNRFDRTLPTPRALNLFHVPSAGYDAVDLSAMPQDAVVCNCYGHEQAIAEYVMAALLERHVPLRDADAQMRAGRWTYRSGARERAHGEIAGKVIGLLGYGHVGKALAPRAKAFEMQVHIANRSLVALSDTVDRFFRLDDLEAFFKSADFLIICLPLVAQTEGIVGEHAFRAMKSGAVIVNVGRGPLVDERALYDALRDSRIAGAVIDTWYAYPKPGETTGRPASLPFHELPNIVMTPHMSGWTDGTLRRRRQTIADNINCFASGRPLLNVVRGAATQRPTWSPV